MHPGLSQINFVRTLSFHLSETIQRVSSFSNRGIITLPSPWYVLLVGADVSQDCLDGFFQTVMLSSLLS